MLSEAAQPVTCYEPLRNLKTRMKTKFQELTHSSCREEVTEATRDSEFLSCLEDDPEAFPVSSEEHVHDEFLGSWLAYRRTLDSDSLAAKGVNLLVEAYGNDTTLCSRCTTRHPKMKTPEKIDFLNKAAAHRYEDFGMNQRPIVLTDEELSASQMPISLYKSDSGAVVLYTLANVKFFPKEEAFKYLVTLMEKQLQAVLPKSGGGEIPHVVEIFDFRGLSMSQFQIEWVKALREFLRYAADRYFGLVSQSLLVNTNRICTFIYTAFKPAMPQSAHAKTSFWSENKTHIGIKKWVPEDLQYRLQTKLLRQTSACSL